MARVRPMDDDAYRVAMAWVVLRRIRRRQRALRRRWHELSREQIQAELLAIGRELVKAAPLVLPRLAGTGAKVTDSRNGRTSSRNQRYDSGGSETDADGARGARHPRKARRYAGQAPELNFRGLESGHEWLTAVEHTLDELERILHELGGEQPTPGT